VTICCATLQVSSSGYYSYLADLRGKKPNDLLLIETKALHAQSRASYGSRRMAKALQSKGFKVGRYRARNLMRKNGLACKQRRRYKVTTQANPDLVPVDNVLNRDFCAAKPNTKWVCDITYLWTQEGWLYLAAVLDLHSRRVIGWSIADHMREELTMNALLMALSRRKPGATVLHHSDRGSQYTSENYRTFLKQYGFNESMSRKGNCWDNAVMERFFGSLKSERTDSINYATKKEAKEDIIDYIEIFYNNKRIHSTLGYRSPVDFENSL
jgi:transposase InsO family protein